MVQKCMTSTVRRIHEIAEQLTPERRQVLLEIAESLVRPSRFFDTMTQNQLFELDGAITEAERNEGLTSSELEARLRKIAPSREA
jgi:hypothetical protein